MPKEISGFEDLDVVIVLDGEQPEIQEQIQDGLMKEQIFNC